MRNLTALLLIIAATVAPAQTLTSTPAETAIAEARRAIAVKPQQPDAYNSLATAFLRRARETDDPAYIQQADEAVQKSLRLAPDNFESQREYASVLLAKHDYAAALGEAKALNQRFPDDVLVYGLLTQANAELGNYDTAEKTAQWMLNLRPGNLPALLNTAYLRELFGDPDGANEVLDIALQSIALNETEERAWILARMAHMHLISGNVDAADKLAHQALNAFPSYHEAVRTLAQVRIAQKRYEDAVTLLRQLTLPSPRATDLYLLATTLELAGHANEAKHAFADFETKALAESSNHDNANRELIFYYADHADQPAKALQLAKQELAWCHDVYTLDTYAWALHANGEDGEAHKQIETALAVGIRDANIFRHAGEIALKTGDLAAAERYLKQSAGLKTIGSEQAQLALDHLAPAR